MSAARPRLRVENPPFGSLLEQVQSGRGIAFAKRTHGVWDHLSLLVTHGWKAQRWRRCDMMIFKNAVPPEPAAQGKRREYMRYLNELLDDVVRPPADDRWWQTVSLDLEYLTGKLQRPVLDLRLGADPRLLSYWDWRYSYADLFARYSLHGRRWRYAQAPTRGVRTLEILELPAIARECHVVVVGPAHLAGLTERWGLDPARFTFVAAPAWPRNRPNGTVFSDPVLPPLQTHRIRHDLLESLSRIESPRPLLHLFELGTCAQWLIRRLFDRRPQHAYLDLGRTLELWFPDVAWPLKRPVAAMYSRAARAYYGDQAFRQLREIR